MEPTFTPNPTPAPTPFSPAPHSAPFAMPQSLKSLKAKAPLIGMVVCAIIAIAGIAFGIYGVTTSESQSSENKSLRSQLAAKDGLISELTETISNMATPDTTPVEDTPHPNPVIISSRPNVTYTLDLATAKDVGYSLHLSVRDGNIVSCGVYSTPKGSQEDTLHHECEVAGLDGKIYKMLEVPYQFFNDIIFIMEDGTVRYLSTAHTLEKDSKFIARDILIDGFVVDVVPTNIIGQTSSGILPVFVLSDGTYVRDI